MDLYRRLLLTGTLGVACIAALASTAAAHDADENGSMSAPSGGTSIIRSAS